MLGGFQATVDALPVTSYIPPVQPTLKPGSGKSRHATLSKLLAPLAPLRDWCAAATAAATDGARRTQPQMEAEDWIPTEQLMLVMEGSGGGRQVMRRSIRQA